MPLLLFARSALYLAWETAKGDFEELKYDVWQWRRSKTNPALLLIATALEFVGGMETCNQKQNLAQEPLCGM